MNLSTARLSCLVLLPLTAVSATAQSLMPTQGQIVAKPGDTPPGVAVGETFGTTDPFQTPVMGRDGNLVFRGILVGASVTAQNDRAMFTGHTKDDLELVIRTGVTGQIPGFPNSMPLQVSSSTGLPAALPNTSNVFAFQRVSPLGGLLMFHTQLWDGGNPGTDNLVHTSAAGTINDNFMIWGAPGALQVLAQQGVTTMPGGAVLSFGSGALSPQLTALNSAGTAVFRSDLLGGDVVGTTNNTAWIIGTPGSLAYFMRETDLLLGGTVGVASNGLALGVLNEQGDAFADVFLSTTLGSAPANLSSDRLLTITPASTGVHTLFAREGDTAPDTTGAPLAGVTFGGSFNLANGFGNDATAAFRNTLTGAVTAADDGALFAGGIGTLVMVAREGDVAQGTGGATLNVIGNTTVYSETHGIVFGSTLTGAGVTVNNDSAMYIAKTGSTTLIAREGDAVPGMPGWFFGTSAGTMNFGVSGTPRVNDRGQVLFQIAINQGVAALTNSALCSWDPLHGLQLQLFGDQTIGDVWGGNMVTSANLPAAWPSNDGNCVCFTENGDFAVFPGVVGGSMIARGHVGSLNGTPSAVPVGGGTPHNLTLDVTPAYGNQLYYILATGLGTDVGFPHPLNGAINVPIDFDPLWTMVSLNAANSPLWANSLGFLDANGKAVLPISFNMPAGFPTFLGLTVKHSALIFDGALVGTYATEPTTVELY